ncbi:MAG: DUF2283 domain-containing protein [Acidobacteriaceae bacterium]
MKLHYYPETDSLYIDLATRVSADSQEIAEGLVVDYDDEGRIVGLDIQHASEHLDLETLETEALPLRLEKLA